VSKRNIHFSLACLTLLVLFNGFVFYATDWASPAWLHYLRRLAVGNVLVGVGLLYLKLLYDRLWSRYFRLQGRLETLQMVSDHRDLDARVLEVLTELSASFLEKVELMPLFDRMSDAVRQILNVDVVAIELLPGEAEEEQVRFLKGTGELELDSELYNDVAFRGKSVLVNHLAERPRYAALRRQGLTAMVLAPFHLRQRIIGFIGAFQRHAHGFSSQDLTTLSTFATHAGLIIESARLLQAVRRLSLGDGGEDVSDLRDLKTRLAFERELADREMDVARRIQTGLLPQALPRLKGIELEAVSRPAKEVGGDYYDILDLGEDRWGLAIADVSGKGVPAALVMVMSRTLLHATGRVLGEPKDVLQHLNRVLFRETDPEIYVSMFYAVWDCRAGTLTYASAGHTPPLHYRAGTRTCEPLGRGGIALGADEKGGDAIQQHVWEGEPDDVLLLFTDGATDADNADGGAFGLERLQAAVSGQAALRRILPGVVSRIDDFCGGQPQRDDITLVTVRRTTDKLS